MGTGSVSKGGAKLTGARPLAVAQLAIWRAMLIWVQRRVLCRLLQTRGPRRAGVQTCRARRNTKRLFPTRTKHWFQRPGRGASCCTGCSGVARQSPIESGSPSAVRSGSAEDVCLYVYAEAEQRRKGIWMDALCRRETGMVLLFGRLSPAE